MKWGSKEMTDVTTGGGRGMCGLHCIIHHEALCCGVFHADEGSYGYCDCNRRLNLNQRI
jgi:hypothetical protein